MIFSSRDYDDIRLQAISHKSQVFFGTMASLKMVWFEFWIVNLKFYMLVLYKKNVISSMHFLKVWKWQKQKRIARFALQTAFSVPSVFWPEKYWSEKCSGFFFSFSSEDKKSGVDCLESWNDQAALGIGSDTGCNWTEVQRPTATSSTVLSNPLPAPTSQLFPPELKPQLPWPPPPLNTSWQASSKIWLTNLANGAFEKRTYMEQFCFTCQLDLGLFTTTDVYFHQLRHHKDHLRPAAPPGALRCPLKPHYDKQGGKIRLAKFNPIFRFLSPILIIRCGCSCQPPEIPILPETGTLSLRRSKEWTQQQLV